VELIGTVVVHEICNILKEERNFDRERFVDALRQLPELPHDKERRIFPRSNEFQSSRLVTEGQRDIEIGKRSERES